MRVGVDIGGTFTDLVYFDGMSFKVVKVPTTPKRPTEGVLNAVETANVDLSDVEDFVHATTLGTNMFLGQEGLRPPKLALVTTKGFRDVVEIGRQRRPDLYDLFFERPKPIVPRRDRYEVEERINARGEVIKPLDEEGLRRIAEKLKEKGYEIVVISFLHSYRNPIHELRAKEVIERVCPGITVITSHEVDPEYKEFERTSTTLVNAFLMPMMSRYLSKLLEELRRRGFSGRFFVMQSSGGISKVEHAIKKPAAFVESGPAAGAVAVAYHSRILGERRVIGFDMGGTTAKACTVIDHEPLVTTEYEIGGRVHAGRLVRGSGYPVRFPFIDLAEVSAGGGTIAWIDEGGALKVGPISAGADPGPVCYGRGNDRPTVTDANLVLGRIGENLSGGTLRLRKDLAVEALSRLANRLGMELEEVALGILKLANTVMAKALRIVTVERGHDPREFTMFVFGGAGGLHGVELAEELGVRSVLIPPHAGVFSAFGLLLSDYRVDRVKSVVVPAEDADEGEMEEEFSELVSSAVAEIGSDVDVEVVRLVDVRYSGQAYEITVPWLGVEESVKAFHEKHEALYGFSSPEESVEIVNLRVTAVGIVPKPKPRVEKREEYDPTPEFRRNVYFDEGWVETPVFYRGKLRAGANIEGPAIVEDYDTTVVVPPGFVASVDEYLNLRIVRC